MEVWSKFWETKGLEVPWQVDGPHKALVKNINALTDGKPNQHILVPLCGASDDLLWLADQGHTVVGIEGTKKAIKIFFDKNKLEYEVSAINLAPSGAYIYKAKHKNITIVEVDFWHFRQSIIGKPFDAVWDRAALLAIINTISGGKGVETGKKYLKILKDVLKPEGRVLLETFLFDPAKTALLVGAKPYLLTDEMLAEICGNDWNMSRIDMIPLEEEEKFMNRVFPFKIDMTYTVLTQRQ